MRARQTEMTIQTKIGDNWLDLADVRPWCKHCDNPYVIIRAKVATSNHAVGINYYCRQCEKYTCYPAFCFLKPLGGYTR